MTIYHFNIDPGEPKSKDGEENLPPRPEVEHDANWYAEEQDMAKFLNDRDLQQFEEQ